MAQIDKNMTVGDILDMDRETAVYFLNMGMHLPRMPCLPRRNRGAGLYGAWRRRRRAGEGDQRVSCR